MCDKKHTVTDEMMTSAERYCNEKMVSAVTGDSGGSNVLILLNKRKCKC